MKSCSSGLQWIGLALVILSGASMASAQTATGPWAGRTLEPAGWKLLDASADAATVLYYRLPVVRPPGALPRLWTRWEFATPQTDYGTAYRSDMLLFEIDCIQGRHRILQYQTYPENNLEGPVGTSSNGPGSWTYTAPSTFGESAQRVVCGAR